MTKKFVRLKVFDYVDMPDNVRQAVRISREYKAFFNDMCVKFGMEHGPGYPDEQNVLYQYFRANGATAKDEHVIINISW